MSKLFKYLPQSHMLWVPLAALLFALPVNAASLQSLISDNKLSVEIRLVSSLPIIVKQPVLFQVEVATERWFAKGTYLEYPRVPDAVMLPASGLGINGTKEINRVTWSSQTREITLYATKSGDYQLPPVEIHVSVHTENEGVVQGSVYTEPLDFSVLVPEALKQYEEYIVSPDVQIDIKEDQVEKESYAVGEAVLQTITISASDVPGMMLPTLTMPEIKGLSIYHKPAQLNDKSSRGELTGIRVESFTFIFEQAGEYQIPGQTFYWWNMQTQELTELTIPAKKWTVSGVALSNAQAVNKRFLLLPTVRQLGAVVLIIMAGVVIYLSYRFRFELLARYAQLTKLHYRTQRKVFLNAIEYNQFPLACDILYQLINHSRETVCSLQSFYADEPNKLLVLERLFDSAYGVTQNTPSINRSDVSLLLHNVEQNKKDSHIHELAERLELNPQN